MITNPPSYAISCRDGTFPLDVNARAQEAEVPENRFRPVQCTHQPGISYGDCVKFLWNATLYEEAQPDGATKLVQRAQELPKGTGLDGWLVFEVPEGHPDSGLSAGASGDTITIEF